MSGFSTFNMRTQEGNEDGVTSALKDLIQGDIDIPSDCGSINIVKKDAATGAVLPGAKFQISPNPTAGSTDQTAKTVTDNDGTVTAGELADADARPGYITVANVAPGVDYTVTEPRGPRGLLPPAGRL